MWYKRNERTTEDSMKDAFSLINESRLLQIKGEESENSYQELKRSPKDRHTQTHGNLFEIFWRSQMSFSIIDRKSGSAGMPRPSKNFE